MPDLFSDILTKFNLLTSKQVKPHAIFKHQAKYHAQYVYATESGDFKYSYFAKMF